MAESVNVAGLSDLRLFSLIDKRKYFWSYGKAIYVIEGLNLYGNDTKFWFCGNVRNHLASCDALRLAVIFILPSVFDR
jgi:hypothetical protein